MLDPKLIRNDPDSVREGLERRAADELLPRVEEILALDAKRRSALSDVNDLKAERNEVSKRIGDMKKRGEDAVDLIAEMRRVGDRIGELDAEVSHAEEGIEETGVLHPVGDRLTEELFIVRHLATPTKRPSPGPAREPKPPTPTTR